MNKARDLIFIPLLLVITIPALAIQPASSCGDSSIPATILPVRYFRFTASQADRLVVLKWSTLHEQNISYFTVERSYDGHSYLPVALVKTSGNNSSNTSYEWFDQQPFTGNNFYRLTTRDLNNFITISEIRKVKFNDPRNPHPVQVIKIAVSGKTIYLNARVDPTRPKRICIYSANGTLCYAGDLQQGDNTLQLAALRKGTYFLYTGYETRVFLAGE